RPGGAGLPRRRSTVADHRARRVRLRRRARPAAGAVARRHARRRGGGHRVRPPGRPGGRVARTADGGRARRRAGGRPARRPTAGVRARRAEADVPVRLLNALFSPRRVALVGASDRKGTLGNLLAANLASFPGEVVPVGSGASLRDVAGEIDLAVVAVPAPAVAADAAAKGVAAMVVLSGGFAEVGEDGAKLQAELVANAGATRVIGPNCFGIQNCDLPLNAS